jgi:hypothetical protein
LFDYFYYQPLVDPNEEAGQDQAEEGIKGVNPYISFFSTMNPKDLMPLFSTM